MGSRLLKRWLHFPLRDLNVLKNRQDAIEQIITTDLHLDVQPVLKSLGDIERIVSRIALGSARPRDFARLRNALQVLPELQQTLSPCNTGYVHALSKLLLPIPRNTEFARTSHC